MLSLSLQAIHSCSAPERIQHYRIGQKKRTLGAVLDELSHEEVGENVLARSDDSLTMANERSTAEEISSSILYMLQSEFSFEEVFSTHRSRGRLGTEVAVVVIIVIVVEVLVASGDIERRAEVHWSKIHFFASSEASFTHRERSIRLPNLAGL